MKKLTKKESLAALILCITLIGATIYVNLPRPIEQYTEGLERKLKPQYGLPNPLTQTSPIVEDERVRDIRQWIKGELKRGTFEDVATSIEEETESLGGYVDSEDLTFTQDLWSGEIVSKIPQNNSLEFVFKVRSLISSNGKVISITTNIKDVTPQAGTTIPKPLAIIRTTLKEVFDQPGQLGLPPLEFPFITVIAQYLGTFFTIVITGVVIGLPAYFTVLGIVLLIDRTLLPLAHKLFKRRFSKSKEALPSLV